MESILPIICSAIPQLHLDCEDMGELGPADYCWLLERFAPLSLCTKLAKFHDTYCMNLQTQLIEP